MDLSAAAAEELRQDESGVFQQSRPGNLEPVMTIPSLAVHGDPDATSRQNAGKCLRSKLAPPGSVLKISGVPYLSRASSSASVQKEGSSVLDNRQASTRRLAQSIMATR
jgi:hypothetical protein